MREPSDDYLVRYLLGDVPAEDAEPLDERSVTDAEFSLRLRALENDLVDRYARGEPFDASLREFDRVYHNSSHLRGKVRFARALTELAQRGDRSVSAVASTTSFRRYVVWLAAAAVILAAAIGMLWVRNLNLRDEIARLDELRGTADRQNALLREALQRPSVPAAAPTPVTATFLLAPPRRGLAAETPTIVIPRGAASVILRLQIESDQATPFWAALRDLTAGRLVWRSGDVDAEGAGGNRFVTITLPAAVFTAERYSVDLWSISANGAGDLIGQYPIRVVLQ